jgi:hypothetical protein
MPVTVTAIEQLGLLTFGLLRSNSGQDLRFSLHEVRRDIHTVAMLVVEKTKDELLGYRHGTALGGIYSATTFSAFPGMLTELKNHLLDADKSDKNAQRIIRNIEIWSDQLYQSQKELLLAAVAARSGFVLDMVNWIVTVTQVLAMLAKADACPKHSRNELERASQGLISTLSWIPDDKETATQIACFSIHERLFECAMKLYQNGCFEVSQTTASELVSSAFRFGRHENGWARLEQSLYCVGVLSLRPELQAATSVEKLSACLAKYPVSRELLDKTARSIRAETLGSFNDRHTFGIRSLMSRENPKNLADAMMLIANMLSPSTAAEPIRSRSFL